MHPVIQQIYKQKCLPLPSPIQPLRGLRYNSGLTDGLVHQRAPLYLGRQIRLLSSSDVFLSIGGINKNKPKQTNKTQTDKNNQKNHKKRKGMFYFSSGQQSSRDWFQSNKRCQSPPQMQSSLDTDCSRPFHGNQESHPCSFFIFIFSSCMYLPCSTWAGAWRQQAGRKQNCVVIARHRPDPSHFIVLPA